METTSDAYHDEFRRAARYTVADVLAEITLVRCIVVLMPHLELAGELNGGMSGTEQLSAVKVHHACASTAGAVFGNAPAAPLI